VRLFLSGSQAVIGRLEQSLVICLQALGQVLGQVFADGALTVLHLGKIGALDPRQAGELLLGQALPQVTIAPDYYRAELRLRAWHGSGPFTSGFPTAAAMAVNMPRYIQWWKGTRLYQ
jgi:hypothetical protein